jgi:hypothetical protein
LQILHYFVRVCSETLRTRVEQLSTESQGQLRGAMTSIEATHEAAGALYDPATVLLVLQSFAK